MQKSFASATTVHFDGRQIVIKTSFPRNVLASLLAIAAILLIAPNCAAQIVVIASAKSPLSSVTRDQTAALFLGKSIMLPNANLAFLTDQPENSPIREQFYLKLTDKSVALVKACWARLVFSGKAARPRELAGSDEVKKFVAANPDALGYIEKSAVDSTVKVLYTIE
jgi:ABC-type phosphate transport system substrate-binding protein